MWTHEESYKGCGAAQFIHRSRLKKIVRLFIRENISERGKYADFGCSNGFIVELLYNAVFGQKSWRLYGFDSSREFVALAREKCIPDAEFHLLDLNRHDAHSSPWKNTFDIVSCFETLEHVGNVSNALETIIGSCKKGGKIFISVPNEKRLPGLLKYCGRKVLRRNAYGDFFKNKSEIRYTVNLITNRSIEEFREPDAPGWGPHLGFDWESFERKIYSTFIETHRCRLLNRYPSLFRFNFIYELKKC